MDNLDRERRDRHYQQAQVPQLRLLGFVVVLLLLGLNRRFVGGDGPRLVWFVLAVLAYNLLSFRALGLSGRHYSAVGLAFLTTDLIFFSAAVLYSCADLSWLFFLPLVRVADQTNTTFRRVIVFAHLAVLGYLAVLLGAQRFEAHVIAWPVEAFKLGLLYSVGVYVALTARTAEGLRKQVAYAVRRSNDSHERLREQTVQLEEARRAAEAASLTKSEFLANMSHEIRTPMTAIQGFSDLLLDPDISSSERLNHIQTIRRNSDHLLTIINDILDLSKIEAGKMSVENIVCSPSQIVVEVASLMRVRAIEKKIDFEVQFQTPIPESIHSDPTRIRQILLNLVSNAIKFTESGGVRLLARCDDDDGLCPKLTLEVVDSGIGLSGEQVSKLFQPFTQANASTTRRFGGSGLGLAICQRMAHMLGGEIAVKSEPGRGSSFSFSIETGSIEGVHLVHDLREACVAAPAGASVPALSGGRILLAEDGIDNQRLISNHLRKAGVTVVTAENGRIAVEAALAAEAAGEPFDLILMDMQMPELDGYGATAKLRTKGYRRPIVALTAHAMAGDRERCLTAGCDDYLTKPIDRVKLLSTVAQHLANGVAPPAPLISSYADDPDMKEIVVMFVDELPGRVSAIRAAGDSDDRIKLSQLAHMLKGAAGGYGFSSITDAAGRLEDALAPNGEGDGDVTTLLAELVALCDRVRSTPAQAPLRRSA